MTELPLRGIHLPDPISWWPLAAGWWIVLVVIIAACLFLKYLSRPYLRKETKKELQRIRTIYQENGDPSACLSELSKLLRRVILSKTHPEKSASVVGERWLLLLDETFDETAFSQGSGRVLLSGPYQSTINKDDVVALMDLCDKVVRKL